jgi:hypothetical protein
MQRPVWDFPVQVFFMFMEAGRMRNEEVVASI